MLLVQMTQDAGQIELAQLYTEIEWEIDCLKAMQSNQDCIEEVNRQTNLVRKLQQRIKNLQHDLFVLRCKEFCQQEELAQVKMQRRSDQAEMCLPRPLHCFCQDAQE